MSDERWTDEVHARDIYCPVCGTAPGKPCNEGGGYHVGRYRALEALVSPASERLRGGGEVERVPHVTLPADLRKRARREVKRYPDGGNKVDDLVRELADIHRQALAPEREPEPADGEEGERWWPDDPYEGEEACPTAGCKRGWGHDGECEPKVKPVAAPDTEGREVGCEDDDVLLHVHPESETCEVCEPHPEEAGGEDELRDTYTDAGLAEACDVAATVVQHHPDKNYARYARVLAHQLEKAADRLRGAPEGAGGPRCEKCGSGDISTKWYDKGDRGYSDCHNRDEHLHRYCRNCRYGWCDPVRTGREERDDG